MNPFFVSLPRFFSYDLALTFLTRNNRELLHRVEHKTLTKALHLHGKPTLFSIEKNGRGLKVEVLNRKLDAEEQPALRGYIRRWFDLDTNLGPFYRQFQKDKLLGPLLRQYKGYRIIGQPDLFESLVWAVLGQQINLAFAYTLKQRFVECFGEKTVWKGIPYSMFPSPEAVSRLKEPELLALQFSRQKAQYTIGIAREFANGNLDVEALRQMPLHEAKDALMKIKGVGNWTANYALMKTFQLPDAFPLEDAGLHNALKNRLHLKEKPPKEQIVRIFKKYKGWEAYATLYLWKSL